MRSLVWGFNSFANSICKISSSAFGEEKKLPCMPSKEPLAFEDSGKPATIMAKGFSLKRTLEKKKKLPCMPSKEPLAFEDSGKPATIVAKGFPSKRTSVKKRICEGQRLL